jgi:hypothetical protein
MPARHLLVHQGVCWSEDKNDHHPFLYYLRFIVRLVGVLQLDTRVKDLVQFSSATYFHYTNSNITNKKSIRWGSAEYTRTPSGYDSHAVGKMLK